MARSQKHLIKLAMLYLAESEHWSKGQAKLIEAMAFGKASKEDIAAYTGLTLGTVKVIVSNLNQSYSGWAIGSVGPGNRYENNRQFQYFLHDTIKNLIDSKIKELKHDLGI